MHIIWRVTSADARRLREFVSARSETPFVRHRVRRNVGRERPPVSLQRFWQAMLLGLLTTQQRSGPDSPVTGFLVQKPFPLTYRRISAVDDPAGLIRRVLRKHGGIRRSNVIAHQASENLTLLRHDWRRVRRELRRLEGRHRPSAERQAAESLASQFAGLGPKQTRNVLQVLGLTQYEIPVDSRITSWLNEFGFPVRLNATGLSDSAYYAFVMDGIQALCRKAGVLPCVLDAAVFSSFDATPWTPELLI